MALGVAMLDVMPPIGVDAHDATTEISSAPIRIDRCSVDSQTVLLDPLDGLREQYVSGTSIRFTNTRRVAATLVRLTVRYAGSSRTVVDRGTFAPNVPIDRASSLFAGEPGSGERTECAIEQVTFADGSVWKR